MLIYTLKKQNRYTTVKNNNEKCFVNDFRRRFFGFFLFVSFLNFCVYLRRYACVYTNLTVI